VISLPLLEVLLKELVSLTDDKESQSLMYQTAARTSYPRRKDEGFLDFCERCASTDIGLHQKAFNSKNKYVYSFVRQAIILEKSGRIDEALTLVDDALARNLDDRTKGNYTERRIRLLDLKEELDAKNKVKEEPEEAEEEVSSAADEAALENIQIFKTAIKARSDFYDRLSEQEKVEFRSYFMEEGPNRLTKDIVYSIDGNNDMFFTKVFNYIYRYRKLITLSLLNKIYQELLSFTNSDAETQTIINELAIRVSYFRRKDPAYLEVSYQWSHDDVKLHRTTLNSKDTYVYSFTRLAIILEKKKLFKEAIELVNDAMKRGLNDKTKTGYNGRLVRLNKKLGAVK
jgi:tetratricopeptide (TPR) repeat protein